MTCGSQFSASSSLPARCPICEDERQYVGYQGQQWTSLEALRETHHNRIERQEEGLYGIATEPRFAIGQRALLLQHKTGNVLWDCISLIDEATVARLSNLGGVAKIAISHPHYYSAMVDWAEAFDAEIFLHAADREWVMRPDARIHFWEGETLDLADGISLFRLGGHFAGGSVCHWQHGASGKGALLSGDIIQVVADRRWLSFMYSYPNLIPLSAAQVHRILAPLQDLNFDRIYGAWWQTIVTSDAKACLERSAARYLTALASP